MLRPLDSPLPPSRTDDFFLAMLHKCSHPNPPHQTGHIPTTIHIPSTLHIPSTHGIILAISHSGSYVRLLATYLPFGAVLYPQTLLADITLNIQMILDDPNAGLVSTLKNLRQAYYKRGFDVRKLQVSRATTGGATADSDVSM